MGFNHRYSLRLSTDLALLIFLLFSVGAILWFTDEFLGWNILPDWIDKYAQLIIGLFGIGAALALAASIISGLALMAEAAAERAHLEDYRPGRRVITIGAGVLFAFLLAFVIFQRIDLYRKEIAQRHQRESAKDSFNQEVRDLEAEIPKVLERFPNELKAALGSVEGLEQNEALVRFLSAIQSSSKHRPEVLLLIRAAPPYQYCRLQVGARNEPHGERRLYLQKQFYLGFPTALESATVEQLFSGNFESLRQRLQGEAISNVQPSNWGVVEHDGRAIALLILKTSSPGGYGFFHSGPGTGSPHPAAVNNR